MNVNHGRRGRMKKRLVALTVLTLVVSVAMLVIAVPLMLSVDRSDGDREEDFRSVDRSDGDRERDFRVVFPITLKEILNGQEPCPAIPNGYRPHQTAVGEEGYYYGDIFIDARVSTATCDSNSSQVVKGAKDQVLRWRVRSCEGLYTLVGKAVKFWRPGDILREILITKEIVDRGCDGLSQAREAARG